MQLIIRLPSKSIYQYTKYTGWVQCHQPYWRVWLNAHCRYWIDPLAEKPITYTLKVNDSVTVKGQRYVCISPRTLKLVQWGP